MKITALLFAVLVSVSQSTLQSFRNETLSLCSSASAVTYKKYTSNVTQNCGCKEKDKCVRKCCQKGFYHNHDEDLDNGLFVSECLRNDSYSFSVPIYKDSKKVRDETDEFLIGTLNCNNEEWQYFKMDNTDPNQKFYIRDDGTLFYEFYQKVYSNDRYCVDEEDGLTAYLCFTPKPPVNKTANLIHMTAKLISVPFLAITGLVYALLPERNLHRNALMNHVFSLIPGSAILAIGQYVVITNDFLCSCQGFLVLFFMIASFFWMNVICIDISLAFSNLRGIYVQEKAKIFSLVASLYAWGLPALNVLIVFLLNTYGDDEASYYPGIGEETCFLRNGLPAVIFYFVPIVVLIIINLGLFIMTVVNIIKTQKETKIVQDSQNKKHSKRDDYKFKLYWKLLFVMGLNPVVNTHVIQMISWSLGNQMSPDTARYIWYYKDFSHACYGLVIFLIFVCQKRIWLALKQRFPWIRTSDKTESKTSVTSSAGSSSENAVTGIRLRGIQNPASDVP